MAANLEFETDETNSGGTSLTIAGQATHDASTFTSDRGDISSRAMTTALVSWTPGPWTTVNERHTSPDISTIIEEIVNDPRWTQGNDIALIINGTGERTAESFDGEPANAARLHLSWQAPTDPDPTTNTTTIVTLGSGDDDVEVASSGAHNVGSNDLDFSRMSRPFGLRYNVCLAPGTSIVEARIQVHADEADSRPTTAAVRAELAPTPAPFDAVSITARQLTTESVNWDDFSVWQEGTVETSPDLSPVSYTHLTLPTICSV